jgi:hypothetical protein
MPKHCYIDKNFRASTLAAIAQANEIIEEYAAQGYELTLRQLYYQFVARDLIPNRQNEYDKLGKTISDGRLAGLVDWNAIVDRTRNLKKQPSWDGVGEILDICADQYREDKWGEQDTRIEVWIEKEALAGVFQRVCEELQVPYFSCRGYVSQSEMWRAAQRFISYRNADFNVVVLHFGDHDPSGIDMTRDIRDRMNVFGARVDVQRLALNMDQVEEYTPPPNPAKLTDARARDYVARFGTASWELDALNPQVLSQLVRDAVDGLRDDERWRESVAREEAACEQLRTISEELS